MKLACNGNIVTWDGGELTFSIRPAEAILVDGKVIVIHDRRAYPMESPCQNLIAYSMTGELQWKAELPLSGPATAYVSFINESPLKAYNFAGFVCTIDPGTGGLLESVFTK